MAEMKVIPELSDEIPLQRFVTLYKLPGSALLFRNKNVVEYVHPVKGGGLMTNRQEYVRVHPVKSWSEVPDQPKNESVLSDSDKYCVTPGPPIPMDILPPQAGKVPIGEVDFAEPVPEDQTVFGRRQGKTGDSPQTTPPPMTAEEITEAHGRETIARLRRQ